MMKAAARRPVILSLLALAALSARPVAMRFGGSVPIREVLFSIGGALALLLLTLGAKRKDDTIKDPATDDPIERLARSKSDILLAVLFATALVLHLFPGVLFGQRTTVSAPYFNIANDPAERTAGFDYLNDAWAGYLIEGPGLAISRKFAPGEPPLWNPYEGAGAPFLADGEVAAASVLQAPLNRTGTVRAWDLYALFRDALAFVFAFLTFRALGRSRGAALFGGAAFAFSAYFIRHANLVHLNTEVFTPLVILFADALARKTSFARTAALAVSSGMALNGGNPQPFVVALFVVFLRSPFVVTGGVRGWARFGASTAFAVMLGASLTAFSLLPLADQLKHSVTRALLAPSGAAHWTSLLAFVAPHGGANTADLELRMPGLWFLGASTAILAIAGTISAFAARSRRRLADAVPLLVLLSACFVPMMVALLGRKLPILSSVNWPKYVGGTVFLAAALAARTLDDARMNAPRTKVWIFCALIPVAAAMLAMRNEPLRFQREHVLIAIALAATALAFWSRARRAGAALAVLFVTVEIGTALPEYPESAAEVSERRPPLVRYLDERQKKDFEREKTIWRTMAHGDLMPPLLSGAMGFFDARSTTPVPLRDYHDWIAPYVNCGVWPPYLLLGATREMLLSPCIDLLGIRWIMIKDHRLLSAQLDKGVEDMPTARFGGFHRAIDFSTFRVSGVRAIDPDRATFTIGGGGTMSFDLDLVARSAKVGFAVTGNAGDAVTIRIGNDRRKIAAGEETIFAMSGYPERLPFELEVPGEKTLDVRISHWEVDRFRPKTPADFRFDGEPRLIDRESGIMALENKTVLPVARIVRRARTLVSKDEFRRIWREFVRTGDGFDWRSEILLYPDENRPLVPLSTEGTAVDPSEHATWRTVGMNRMQAHVELKSPAWLHLAVTDDGHWTAKIGDRPVPIVRANGPFMAVPIESSGAVDVDFEYRPRPYHLGRTIALIAAGITGILIVLAIFRRLQAPRVAA